VLRRRRVRTAIDTPAKAVSGTSAPSEHYLLRAPGNECLRLELAELDIQLPRLPPALDGLSIVHFSDLHFTGRVGKSYFQQLVRLSNELQPDLVAITGDLVDQAPYISWIPETLGQLTSRYGVYCVFGNHDLRVDTVQLAHALEQNGLIHLGGRWLQVEVRGVPVVLAGNELPWLAAADVTDCPPRGQTPLRIVLAHSPDQFRWARAWDADLLLAGHTHGGQIRLPLLGPIFSPSWHGVRYAAGLFHVPPTVMHVTRGVSCELPIRWNCPPEMSRIVLHKASRR
jgi:uncharacterized protein